MASTVSSTASCRIEDSRIFSIYSHFPFPDFVSSPQPFFVPVLEQIFPSVIIQNMSVHICNHIDLSMAGITLYRFDISTIQFQLISNTEIAGTVNIDNMYEFASSHCNDFKDLRDDEDIVINREWILNKLAEVENE